MIESIHIKNYKSILDLSFDVGRVNVLIGENGCGKSNILEALVLTGAAEANKLDNEFLANRGIRVTAPALMRSGFNQGKSKVIEVTVKFLGQDYVQDYTLEHDDKPYSSWKYLQVWSDLKNFLNAAHIIPASHSVKNIDETEVVMSTVSEQLYEKFEDIRQKSPKRFLEGMIIYSPEETSLRNFHQDSQIEPLGIYGEGLFKLLKVLSEEESKIPLDTLRTSLTLLDWFEDIDFVDTDINVLDELKVILSDRFIGSKFDQRSANEGFLFILFYTALMVSKDTPKIFAIDNVDASLNPKLCTKIMTDIAQLAKQFDKQCFLTTHNPAILDGLDLGDDEQRLFVVSRNRKGHTRIKRITVDSKPISSTGEELKLSEAFLRGYLGGLPKNF
ncbi:putative ATPase [Leptolyngbya sp. PCC 7375]|nr:putative ATPase [Leptolyngbya sp. PCC 7375]